MDKGYKCLFFVIWGLLIEPLSEFGIEHNAICSLLATLQHFIYSLEVSSAESRGASLCIITYLSTRFPHAALLLPYDPCHWDCITGGTSTLKVNGNQAFWKLVFVVLHVCRSQLRLFNTLKFPKIRNPVEIIVPMRHGTGLVEWRLTHGTRRICSSFTGP